ncbi:MAG: S1/P1 nuclease [Pseudomonadota bacterium]
MMIRLFAAVALLFATAPASAYWEYGHETVAAIAWANVTPHTRVAIRRLLAQQALVETPECPAGTIEQASVWADCVKPLKNAAGENRFGYAYNWHFQNVNVCQPFDLTSACKDGNCVSAQIEREVALLKGRTASNKARLEALLFLTHFVGDLHQPLHAGDRSDRGGNDVKANYGIYGPERFNLHSVWDGPLAERAISTPPLLVRRYSAAVRARDTAGSVTDWSRENWQVSRDFTYATALGGDACGPVPPRATLDDATVARLVPVMRDQVRRGGLRLARLLDRAFG